MPSYGRVMLLGLYIARILVDKGELTPKRLGVSNYLLSFLVRHGSGLKMVLK